MSEKERVFEYRLDFLYQSIAIYAGTLVLYLLVREEFLSEQFPLITGDPILGLLSVIILLSIGALLYNLIMRRRVIITENALYFSSAVRARVFERSEILAVQFARERSTKKKRGLRIVRIRIKGRRRAFRVYPHKFNDTRGFVEALKTWAGPLAVERQSRSGRKRRTIQPARRSPSAGRATQL